ncbi:MAG TPA: zf-HC2 domain-containing protein, partial [Thermoanaerobaculia bacterium]
MDHAYIESHGLVERYHRGLLSPEEEASFEEHFVTCAECMEQLELARGFQKGLKAAVAEDVAQAALARAGLFAWLARRSRLAQLGLAVLLLSLLSLPSLLSFSSLREQRRVAEGLEAERRKTQELRQRLAESEQQRAEERRTLEGKLAEAGKTAPPEPPRGLPGPLVNT